MSDSKLMIFAGNANPALASKVASRLELPLGKSLVTQILITCYLKFRHQINSDNVLSHDVLTEYPTQESNSTKVMGLFMQLVRW